MCVCCVFSCMFFLLFSAVVIVSLTHSTLTRALNQPSFSCFFFLYFIYLFSVSSMVIATFRLQLCVPLPDNAKINNMSDFVLSLNLCCLLFFPEFFFSNFMGFFFHSFLLDFFTNVFFLFCHIIDLGLFCSLITPFFVLFRFTHAYSGCQFSACLNLRSAFARFPVYKYINLGGFCVNHTFFSCLLLLRLLIKE